MTTVRGLVNRKDSRRNVLIDMIHDFYTSLTFSPVNQRFPSTLSELIHKALVELDNPVNPLRTRRQKRRPKMQSTLLLCLRDRLLRHRDGGEEIHRSLGRLALDAFHLAERLVESIGARLQGLEDAVVLGFVQRVRGFAFLGWIHHHFDYALADDGRAELDRDEFVDLCFDLRNC